MSELLVRLDVESRFYRRGKGTVGVLLPVGNFDLPVGERHRLEQRRIGVIFRSLVIEARHDHIREGDDQEIPIAKLAADALNEGFLLRA